MKVNPKMRGHSRWLWHLLLVPTVMSVGIATVSGTTSPAAALTTPVIEATAVVNEATRPLPAVPATLAASAPQSLAVDSRAETLRPDLSYGFSWSRGRLGVAHGWVVMSWYEVAKYGSATALSAFCSKVIGVPFSGGPCGQMARRVWAMIPPRGWWANHGVFIEIGINRSVYVGTW